MISYYVGTREEMNFGHGRIQDDSRHLVAVIFMAPCRERDHGRHRFHGFHSSMGWYQLRVHQVDDYIRSLAREDVENSEDWPDWPEIYQTFMTLFGLVWWVDSSSRLLVYNPYCSLLSFQEMIGGHFDMSVPKHINTHMFRSMGFTDKASGRFYDVCHA